MAKRSSDGPRRRLAQGGCRRLGIGVLPVMLACLAAGTSNAADGRLGPTSSATMRISLVVPDHAGALARVERQGPQRALLARICLSGQRSQGFRLHHGDPRRAAPRGSRVMNTGSCLEAEPASLHAGRDGLLVLEPE